MAMVLLDHYLEIKPLNFKKRDEAFTTALEDYYWDGSRCFFWLNAISMGWDQFLGLIKPFGTILSISKIDCCSFGLHHLLKVLQV